MANSKSSKSSKTKKLNNKKPMILIAFVLAMAVGGFVVYRSYAAIWFGGKYYFDPTIINKVYSQGQAFEHYYAANPGLNYDYCINARLKSGDYGQYKLAVDVEGDGNFAANYSTVPVQRGKDPNAFHTTCFNAISYSGFANVRIDVQQGSLEFQKISRVQYGHP